MTDKFRRRFTQAMFLTSAAAAFACSAGDLVLPQPEAEVRLTVVTGNQQTGTVGEVLSKPLIVELRDEQGAVLVGRKVAFAFVDGPAEASLAPDTATTDSDGQAVGQWTLGTMPGAYSAEARVLPADPRSSAEGLPVAPFVAAAQPGPPDTLRAESRITQNGRPGQPVPEPPAVRVVDRFGNPVPGALVNWLVTAGGGSVSAGVTPTDTEGRATVTWTLGNRLGVHQLSVNVTGGATGSPMTFTAVVFF